MTRYSIKTSLLGLVGWLAATFIAGALGAVASVRAADFYAHLTQPSWAPPAWLFGPVWTVLYILMAVGAWLVWRERGLAGARVGLSLFVIQLIANAAWTWLFFHWHLGALSMAEIVVLWFLIAATISTFWPIHRVAAALLVPYLAWVSLATALTWSLWRMNPVALG